MHFAFLGGLWFSLSALFIVLLYLLKRRYVDTEVSSHLLWQRVLREQEANRPWQRLRRQLLLWLQLLAALLFVLALMQPFIRGKITAKAHVFFVLDASASMQTSTENGTRLDQAKAAMLTYAREKASDSAFSLLVMKDEPEVLLEKQNGLSALQKALSTIAPFYGKTKTEEALSLAAALTKKETNAEIRVYTDGQWTDGVDRPSFSVPLFMELVDQTSASNVSIPQFGVKGLPDGSEFQAAAALKNWGSAPVSVQTTLSIDAKAAHVEMTELQAGEQKSIYIDHLSRGRVYKLQIDTKDGLEADNTSYAFPENSGPAVAAYIGEGNLFLEKALAIAKVDVLSIQKSADGTYPFPLGNKPDILVMDGVEAPALQGDLWKQLVASTPVWRFASPIEAGDTKGAAAMPPYTVADHPLTRYVHLKDVHVTGAKTYNLRPWEKAIVSSDSTALLLAGTEEGIPQVTFTFSLQQSDFALRSEFPVLVQNTVNWLMQSHESSLGRSLAGERKEIALHPEAADALWKPESGKGKEWPAERNADVLLANQTVPSEPGLYQFIEMNKEGRVVQSRMLQVYMDARESNVNAKTEMKLNADNPDVAVEQGKEVSYEVTLVPWMMIALLILLLLEWEVYRRGHTV
ncbi:VWA domain-containing protein [Paenibacillus sp. SI8]|uniref:VWA domain-containing protein n=1 Tax=unclassified Paenibacillus TaxID=185978 RepID=UPI0034653061